MEIINPNINPRPSNRKSRLTSIAGIHGILNSTNFPCRTLGIWAKKYPEAKIGANKAIYPANRLNDLINSVIKTISIITISPPNKYTKLIKSLLFSKNQL